MPKQNTLIDWLSDFSDIGIPETILKSAVAQIKDLNFEQLFESCEAYMKLFAEIIKVPFISTDWQIMLLSQDAKLIEKISKDKVRNYPEEVLYPVAFRNPTLAVNLLNENFDLFKKLHSPIVFVVFCSHVGALNLVIMLLQAIPEIKKYEGGSFLYSMAASGNLAGIQHLLSDELQEEYGSRILGINGGKGGLHLLLGVCLSGNVELFNYCYNKYPHLLDKSATDGTNCAHLAASHGGKEIIQRIYELAPSQFDQDNKNGFGVLQKAAMSKNPHAIQNLIMIKPDINFDVLSGRNKRPILHIAAEFGTLQAVQFLMAQCPNAILQQSVEGSTLLHAAAASGKLSHLKAVWPHCSHYALHIAPKRGSILKLAFAGNNLDAINFIMVNAPQILSNFDELAQTVLVNNQVVNPFAAELMLKLVDLKNIISKLLMQAAEKCDRLMLAKLLEHPIDLLTKQQWFSDITRKNIVWAVELVCMLEPNILDQLITTPQGYQINQLHFAIMQRRIAVAKAIFEKRPNLLSNVTSDGRTSFWMAVANEDLELMNWIFEKAPLQPTVICGNFSVLQKAIQIATDKNLKVLQWILKKIPSLTIQKHQGLNILGWAMINGFSRAFATLITYCPDWLKELIDEQQIDIENFLLAFHNQETLQQIIDLCPELLNRKSNSGCTILHLAAQCGDVEIIQLLFDEVPEQVYLMDAQSHTLLHHTIRSKNIDAVKTVLTRFPKLISVGNPVLHYAIQVGDIPIVELIIKVMPKQLDLITPDGSSILSNAALSGNPEMFNEMLQRKPVLLSTIRNGKSYLHYAADSPHHVEMITYLISNYPNESVQWWEKDVATKQTPDERIKKHALIPSASKILTDLLKKAILNILNNVEEALEASVELLEAYKSRFFQLIYEYALFSEQEIDAVLQSSTLKEVLGEIQYKKLSQAFSLLKLQQQLANKPLTKECLCTLVKTAKESVDVMHTTYYVTKSAFCRDLMKFVSALNSDNLDQDQILTLSVIIQDYQLTGVNDNTRTTDTLLLQALEASTALRGLKPQSNLPQQRNIDPSTFSNDLAQCRGMIPILDSVTLKQVNKVFNGIEHIIANRNAIVQHVRRQYGVPYEVAKNLPIHTNHAPKDKPAECYAALQRLIREFFAAFYLAHAAGHLNTFCHKISTGHCLEDILREPLEWVSQLSEIQTFPELMQRYFAEYEAYQKVMHQVKDDALGKDDEITAFILKRHNGFLCKPIALYADQGVVNEEGIRNYLHVLFLEKQNPAKAAKKAL